MSDLNEKKWLVIYTRPKWEKKVDRLLKIQGIESYCPLRHVENQWADRKKEVSLPLFNSYIFVRVSLREQHLVLYCSGVMGYIYYMERPAIVKDDIIGEIKKNLAIYKDIEIVNLQQISIGDRVKIKDGTFINQIGKVLKVNGKNILMVFDSINCAMVTHIPIHTLTLAT